MGRKGRELYSHGAQPLNHTFLQYKFLNVLMVLAFTSSSPILFHVSTTFFLQKCFLTSSLDIFFTNNLLFPLLKPPLTSKTQNLASLLSLPHTFCIDAVWFQVLQTLIIFSSRHIPSPTNLFLNLHFITRQEKSLQSIFLLLISSSILMHSASPVYKPYGEAHYIITFDQQNSLTYLVLKALRQIHCNFLLSRGIQGYFCSSIYSDIIINILCLPQQERNIVFAQFSRRRVYCFSAVSSSFSTFLSNNRTLTLAFDPQ